MKKVLIVDDTKNIRTLLTTCLELNGYETITASNGLEAIELFKNNSIDLAFIDIKMPEISGTEVLRRIRAMGIDTTVIIMTAFSTVRNAVECTKLGAIAYLQKPFTADKVRNLLNEIEPIIFKEKTDNNYIELAKDLISKSRLEEGLSILKKALGENIDSAEIYYLIGKIYALKGDEKQSEKFFAVSKQFQ